jgi:hypothetical protein
MVRQESWVATAQQVLFYVYLHHALGRDGVVNRRSSKLKIRFSLSERGNGNISYVRMYPQKNVVAGYLKTKGRLFCSLRKVIVL